MNSIKKKNYRKWIFVQNILLLLSPMNILIAFFELRCNRNLF